MAEEVAVFGDVDRVDACTEDVNSVFLKFAGNVKWSLSTELCDYAIIETKMKTILQRIAEKINGEGF